MASTAGVRPSQGSAAAGPGGAAGGGSFAGRGASASTCYKCGKGGHWARDCTAAVAAGEWASGPASQRDGAASKSQPGQGPNGSEAAAGGDENAAPEDGTQQTETGKKRIVKKRPKLTWEMMIGDRGIPHVYKEIPDAFRKQFKGRGHEAGDLGRLLALYDGWQKQLYPNAESFDSFLAETERFSNQGITKMHLREMRDGVLELSGVNKTMQMSTEAGGPAGSPAAAGGGGDMAEEHGGAPELDEEELMELQAMGGGGAPMEQQEGAGDGHGMDDDEMMAGHEEPHMMQEAPGGLDEDEMAALEDEMFM